MTISHKDHDHENTPAARAKCRKQMKAEPGRTFAENAGVPAKMTVVPRKRGDGGVVRGMGKHAPGCAYPKEPHTQCVLAAKPLKRQGTFLRADHDLADVPRMLAYGVRLAWAIDWDVKVGDRFNENEARIEIHGDKGIISLVWRDKRPDGIWKIWVRNYDSSKQFVVDSVQEAIAIMDHDSDRWDEYGNLIA